MENSNYASGAPENRLMVRDTLSNEVPATDGAAYKTLKSLSLLERSDEELNAAIKRWQVSPINTTRAPLPALESIHDGIKWKAYTGIFNQVFQVPQMGTTKGIVPDEDLGLPAPDMNVYRLIIQPWVSDQPVAHMFATPGAGLYGPASVPGQSPSPAIDTAGIASLNNFSMQGLVTEMVPYDFDLAGETGFIAGVPDYTENLAQSPGTSTDGVIYGVYQTGYTKQGGIPLNKRVEVKPGNAYIGETMADVGLHPAQPGSGWGVQPSTYGLNSQPNGNQNLLTRFWPVGCTNPGMMFCNLTYKDSSLNQASRITVENSPLYSSGTEIGDIPYTNATPLAWPFNTDFAVAQFEGGYIEAEITVANGATCKVSACGSNQIRNFGMHTLDGTSGGPSIGCSLQSQTRTSALTQLRRAFEGDMFINADDYYFDALMCEAGKLSQVAGYDNIVMGGETAKTFYYSLPYAMGASGLTVMKSALLPDHPFCQYYQGTAGATYNPDTILYIDLSNQIGSSKYPTNDPGKEDYIWVANNLATLDPLGRLYPDNGHLGVQSMWEAQAGMWYSSYGSTQPNHPEHGAIVAYPQSTYPSMQSVGLGQGPLLRESGAHGGDNRGAATQGVTVAKATRIVRACSSLSMALAAGMPQLEVTNTTPASTQGASVTISIKGKNFFNFIIRHDNPLWSTAASNAIPIKPFLREGRNLIRPAVGRSSVSADDARDNMHTIAANIRQAKGNTAVAKNQGMITLPPTDPNFNGSGGIVAHNILPTDDQTGSTMSNARGYVMAGTRRFAEITANALGYDSAGQMIGDGMRQGVNAGMNALRNYRSNYNGTRPSILPGSGVISNVELID
jgi:hypothetical protein